MTKPDKITNNKGKGKEEDKHREKNQEKWAIYTFRGKEVNTALNYSKLFNIKMSYKTGNTAEKILAYENVSEIVKF